MKRRSRGRRAQPRDHRGRYVRGPRPPAWAAGVAFLLAVLLVVLVNL